MKYSERLQQEKEENICLAIIYTLDTPLLVEPLPFKKMRVLCVSYACHYVCDVLLLLPQYHPEGA